MSTVKASPESPFRSREYPAKFLNGMLMLVLNTLVLIAGAVIFILCIIAEAAGEGSIWNTILLVKSGLFIFFICPLLYAGLKILQPNEALVLALFGKYIGTLRGEGFFFVNPFVSSVNPTADTTMSNATLGQIVVSKNPGLEALAVQKQGGRKISLKSLTLNNDKQKINDKLGNPIIIGIVVIWRVIDTAKAVFSVENYKEFLSIQCDSALRNVVRLYPYDSPNDETEISLRGSSLEISEKIKTEIQSKISFAGLEVIESRITQLSYAPEIAAAMLQRQQASAIIDARQMIVEGAVGMVEMALARLNEKQIVNLDEERKAAMVSNLLVVLCGNKDAQPIVNTGTIY